MGIEAFPVGKEKAARGTKTNQNQRAKTATHTHTHTPPARPMIIPASLFFFYQLLPTFSTLFVSIYNQGVVAHP